MTERTELSPAATALVAYLNTRVAIRRLRSTLRVFDGSVDAAALGATAQDLKWFAGLLGDVRDCQVQARRFNTAVDALPDELVMGAVRSRIYNDLRAIELPARTRVAEAMGSARYLGMLAEIRRWRDDPPLPLDLKSAQLGRNAKRAYRKADRRLATALQSSDDALLHRARKAAKRSRYAAELIKPTGKSKSAKRKVGHYKKIQSALGDHQDTVVATGVLRQMGAAAGTTVGENGFTFGLLYAREQQIARENRSTASSV